MPAPHHREPHQLAPDVLSRVLQGHLDELCEQIAADDAGRSLPRFVEAELRAMAACGDLTRGFAHFRCGRCRTSRVVPLTCKSRLCPTCAGRRMAEVAAHLVDRVLRPELRWRQWVVTFPAPVAVGLCFRASLAAAVTRVCVAVLFAWQRARAAEGPPNRRHPAAVAFVQRFSDGAGAWWHLHILAPDGLFCQPPDTLAAPFLEQPPPQQSDVVRLARTIATRVQRLLARRGWSQLLPSAQVVRRCAAVGARRIASPSPPPSRGRRPTLCADHQGFAVHAGVAIAPHRTDALERLCRYLARPPVPRSRLRLREDGRVVLTLKRSRRGASKLVFEPAAFVARLAALVPPPRWHLTRYFGALAHASPIRAAAIPPPPVETADSSTSTVAPKRPRRMRWAALMRRVFLVDVLRCPCGGTLQPLGIVRNPTAVDAILAAVVLSSQPTVRGPPSPT
jgi:hypothetical protein